MTEPKRPSNPLRPSVRGGAAPLSNRPSTIRDAITEAHALGGGAVARPSAIARNNAAIRKTILLVDPDASLRQRIRALLEMHYDVLEANDGMEAVELTSKMQPPAMIVADTQMARMDGFAMAKILRGNPVMRRVPIMFVSAQNDAQHVTQALVIGVSQYLPKTTPVAQIVEKIRKIAL